MIFKKTYNPTQLIKTWLKRKYASGFNEFLTPLMHIDNNMLLHKDGGFSAHYMLQLQLAGSTRHNCNCLYYMSLLQLVCITCNSSKLPALHATASVCLHYMLPQLSLLRIHVKATEENQHQRRAGMV